VHSDCCSNRCMTYSYFCAPILTSDKDFDMLPPRFNDPYRNWRHARSIRPIDEALEIVTLPDDKSNTGNHAIEIDSLSPKVHSAVESSLAMPTNNVDEVGSKIPMLPPPPQHSPPSFNPDDITLFTTMFLNLFKNIAEWRNLVASDAVQSVWQSPPMIDFSHRLFGT
ncbi:hypothetical protein KR222_001001, partial [Zaprionus bogoriensis]